LTLRFSIVIPTHQRRDLVAANVAALARQRYEDFEVVEASPMPPRAPAAVVLLSPDASTESAPALELKWPVAWPKPKLLGIFEPSSVVGVSAAAESSSGPGPADTSVLVLPLAVAPLAAAPLPLVVLVA